MIEYKLDRSGPSVHITMGGALGDNKALRCFSDLADDIEDLENVSGLIDTRGLEALEITAKGVRHIPRLVEQHEDLFAKSRWAIVAESDVVFGVSRMYVNLRAAANCELKVFRGTGLAREWLGAIALLQSESLRVEHC